MHIILNATTIFKGGAVQAATANVLQALRHPDGLRWRFVLSEKVAHEVSRFASLPAETVVFERSPARNLSSRRKLKSLVDELKPDLVFTVRGPAYVAFSAPHAITIADGYVTHANWSAVRSLRFPRDWLFFGLNTLYKTFWIRKAEYWFVQTEVARQGLHRRARLPLDRISVIPNACAEHYRQQSAVSEFPAASEKVRLLSFAAAYPHKNLDLLPDVAAHLQRLEPALNFEMVLTLPDGEPLLERINRRAAKLNVTQRIVNRGPVPVAEGPDLYRSCHVSMLPTNFETYSATYAESMAMGLPIITTDLNFAHDACRDAALYFEARNAAAAAREIQRLIHDPDLRRRLVSRGKEILSELPTPRQRYEMYVEVLKRLVANPGQGS
jgi:glycosyltransferase involved in cell wall biosynthesis